jgi:hypothetical protein
MSKNKALETRSLFLFLRLVLGSALSLLGLALGGALFFLSFALGDALFLLSFALGDALSLLGLALGDALFFLSLALGGDGFCEIATHDTVVLRRTVYLLLKKSDYLKSARR